MYSASLLLLALAGVLAVTQGQNSTMDSLIAAATTPVPPTGGCQPYPCKSSEDFLFPNWDNCAEYYACKGGTLFKGSCATVMGVSGDAFFSPMSFTCSNKVADAAPCQQ